MGCRYRTEYEYASNLRDRQKELEREVDELVGSKGYYQELIRMEKINYHLEQLKETYFGLKVYNLIWEKISALRLTRKPCWT